MLFSVHIIIWPQSSIACIMTDLEVYLSTPLYYMSQKEIHPQTDLVRNPFGTLAGLNHRAWTLASACGLYLDEVEYPSYASHDEYMYPDAPHDAFGRLDFKKLPMEERSGVSEMMKIRKYSLQGALSEECDDGLD